jgi:predicted transcriptional regulator
MGFGMLVPTHIIHMIGKDARRRIIELLVRAYGPSQTAQLLGVSKPAVTKYMKGETHPTDSVIARVLERVDDNILQGVLLIIGQELINAVNDYNELLKKLSLTRRSEHLLEELREAIYRLEETIASIEEGKIGERS